MRTLILFLSILFLLPKISICQNPLDSGVSKNAAYSKQLEADRIFVKVDSEAQFPGGTGAWIEYLQNNLDPEIPIKKKAPAGTYQVIVKFIVAKNGKIKGIEPETHYGYGMEKEVIRIIKKGPNWMPAMQDGNAVNAYRRQPVTFEISEE